mmetsp:Transcript_40074/g.82044  ORF Transcript_40074/g.82044 Transcript_40074/m.82044 type:complete len:503 (-) Transcript_40074:1749-3257(-)
MELHGGDWQRLVADAHDAAVGGVRSGFKVLGEVGAVERVVPPAHDLGWKVGEDALVLVSLHLHHRRLPVHRHRKDVKLAAVTLDHALEAETNSEDGYSALLQRLDRLRHLEVGGVAGARREDGHGKGAALLCEAVDLAFCEADAVWVGADRHHLRARLPDVVGQSVHERVLVVDEEDALALAFGMEGRGVGGVGCGGVGRGGGAADGVEEGRGLELRLRLLRWRVRVEEQRGARPHLGDAVDDADGAEGEARVDVAVEPQLPHCPAVPAPGGALVVLEELHGPGLGGAGDGDGPRVREEGVEGVEPLPQRALHMVHRVDQPRVHLDLPPPQHLDAAGLADAALVIAINVRAHGQLALLLDRVQQLLDVVRVLDRRLPARDRPTDRTRLHPPPARPHIHLGRRANQKLSVAEVNEEGVGGGVADADAAVDFRGRRIAGLVEGLRAHRLEEVAALELLLRFLHQLRVLSWLVVSVRLGRVPLERRHRPCPRQPRRRRALVAELV